MKPQKNPIQNQHLPCIWSSQSKFKIENQAKKKKKTQSTSAYYVTKDQQKKNPYEIIERKYQKDLQRLPHWNPPFTREGDYTKSEEREQDPEMWKE